MGTLGFWRTSGVKVPVAPPLRWLVAISDKSFAPHPLLPSRKPTMAGALADFILAFQVELREFQSNNAQQYGEGKVR